VDDGSPIDAGWQIDCLATDEAVAEAAARHVVQAAAAAIDDHGRFDFAVSGGRTPWLMFGHLATMDMPWVRTRVFQVDERIAPADDPSRNLLHLREALAGAPADVLPMPVDGPDPETGALQYGRMLPERFDLIHLGLGPDGHTASLVPRDPILEVLDRPVAVTSQAYQGHRRMSLTYPVLDSAHQVLWLVTGSEKATALSQLLAHDPTIPAGRVTCGDNLVICDGAAGSGLVHPA